MSRHQSGGADADDEHVENDDIIIHNKQKKL
jgi:hypothetical protein